VRSDGTGRVLDFGLAKAIEPAAGSSPNLSMSPTITPPAMTQAGTILGGFPPSWLAAGRLKVSVASGPLTDYTAWLVDNQSSLRYKSFSASGLRASDFGLPDSGFRVLEPVARGP
jgi:hypothetical protein